MAVTITQQPQSPNAAYTKLLYVVSGSGTTSNPQYQYVLDLYPSGSTDRISRLFTTPNPAGVGVFEISRIVQGELSYPYNWKDLLNSGSLSNNLIFEVQAGEAYGTSISSSITVYPSQSGDFLNIITATVDPTAGTFNFIEAYPRISSSTSSDDSQLSDNPYQFNRTLYNPYPTVGGNDNSFQPIGNNDHYTSTCYAPKTTLFQTTVRNTLVLVYDESDSVIFEGYPYFSLEYHGAAGTTLARPLYSGSIDTEFYSPGIGTANLRDVRMRSQSTGSLGDKTFGEVIDSGSWLSYYAISLGIPNGFNDVNYFVNEKKIDLVYDIANSNKNVPYYVNCNEKLIFAFINKFGVWDYWFNYNPVRKVSNVERDNVDLPFSDYSSATSAYNIENRGTKNYHTSVRDTFEVDTDYLDQIMANFLEELIESPEVYIVRQGEFIPIIITNSTYQHNNSTSRNKTFKYTITFQPAKQPYYNWIPEFVNS